MSTILLAIPVVLPAPELEAAAAAPPPPDEEGGAPGRPRSAARMLQNSLSVRTLDSTMDL